MDNPLQLKERHDLFVQLEDQPWAYVGPSPTWNLETGEFIGYRVGFYNSYGVLRSLEERQFPATKEVERNDGEKVKLVDRDAWAEFVFPIEEWES